MATALDANPATLEERSICVLALGFAMKEFDENWKIWRYDSQRTVKLLIFRTELGPIS